jgi:hypothetical protein
MSEHHAPEDDAPAGTSEPPGSGLGLRRTGSDLVSKLSQGRRPAILALVLYGVLLIALNTRSVSISLVFFTIHTGLLVLIAVSGAVGFACGYLLRRHKDSDRTDS